MLLYSSKENLIPNEKMSLRSDFLRNIAEKELKPLLVEIKDLFLRKIPAVTFKAFLLKY